METRISGNIQMSPYQDKSLTNNPPYVTDTVNSSHPGGKYKIMHAHRLTNYEEAIALIERYNGEGKSITTEEYFSNLMKMAINNGLTYSKYDCSGFLYQGRDRQGYHGATTNFCCYSVYYGHIEDLGGYDFLIPGMELYQACRKAANSPYFYASHIGVYAGFFDFGDGKGRQHAVFQSSGVSRYKSISVMNREKRNGPNLTSMNQRWNYWGWSRYVIIA